MGYKVNAQNVLRGDILKKRLTSFFIGFSLWLIAEIFLIYTYLSYVDNYGVSEYGTLLTFVMSLSYIFTEECFTLPISMALIKEIWVCLKNLTIFNLIAILLLSLQITSFDNFKGVEYGSAHWATKKDKKPYKDDKNTIPLANELYVNPHKNKLKNVHELVIGDTGAGKTFCKLIPDMLQGLGNYVVADVKGTLYRQLAKPLKKMGYNIKVLNLRPNEMIYSNTFNPLAYVETDNDVMALVNTFKINSRDEDASTGGQFWEDTMQMLLTSVITYLTQNKEETKTFTRAVDLITSLEVVKEKIVPTCEYEKKMRELEMKDPLNAAVLLYKSFKQSAGDTLSSVLISTTSRLKLWMIEDVRILTSSDEMDLDNLAESKNIIFIEMEQNDATYKVISAMFISLLFKRTFKVAEKKYGGKLPDMLNVELDEFANIGKINNFDSVITTARSYGVRIVPIIQSMQQLAKLYKDADKTIISNCAIFNYLGTNDMETRKNLVERLGKTTIGEINHSRNKGGKQGGGSESDRGLGRELLTVDELGRLDTSATGNSIVLIDGTPYFCEKFKTQNHPLFPFIGNDIKESEGFKNNTYIEIEFADLYKQHLDDYIAYKEKAKKPAVKFIQLEDESTEGGEDMEKQREHNHETNQTISQPLSEKEFEEMVKSSLPDVPPPTVEETEPKQTSKNSTASKWKPVGK